MYGEFKNVGHLKHFKKINKNNMKKPKAINFFLMADGKQRPNAPNKYFQKRKKKQQLYSLLIFLFGLSGPSSWAQFQHQPILAQNNTF